jgi:hypothetical protein
MIVGINECFAIKIIKIFLAFSFSKNRKCKLDFRSQGDQRAPELRRAAEERERCLGEKMTTSYQSIFQPHLP